MLPILVSRVAFRWPGNVFTDDCWLVLEMHGGLKVYRGSPAAARSYVEADRARADDYYLGEGTGLAQRYLATPEGVRPGGTLTDWGHGRVTCLMLRPREPLRTGVMRPEGPPKSTCRSAEPKEC